MRKLHIGTAGVLAIVIVLMSAAAWAFPPFLATFTSTYKVKADTALGKASCATCHTSKDKPSELNPYGKDLLKALQNDKVTKASLAKVEKLDSDKDGVSNIQEINAGTLPGDPRSK